jgi:hypothetical protein
MSQCHIKNFFHSYLCFFGDSSHGLSIDIRDDICKVIPFGALLSLHKLKVITLLLTSLNIVVVCKVMKFY